MTVGSISGVAAVAIMVGLVIARLTTTSKYSAETIVAGVTIGGAFIGGLLVAPYLNGITFGTNARSQDKDWS